MEDDAIEHDISRIYCALGYVLWRRVEFPEAVRVFPTPLTGSCESNKQKTGKEGFFAYSVIALTPAPSFDPGREEIHQSHSIRNWDISQKAQGIMGLMVERLIH